VRDLLLRLLGRVPRHQRWRQVPDHETPSVLCRLAWHAWAVTEIRDRLLGERQSYVVARRRECRSCGVVEVEEDW